MILPDHLAPGLRLVFCGTAAGAVSARVGAYYAGPGNRFWPTLHAVGLTPHRYAPTEGAALLLSAGIGLTDLCKTRSGADSALGRDPFDVPRLVAAVVAHRPAVVAFTSLTAGRAALGREAAHGRSPAAFAGTEAWVLPSPSGLATRWWDPAPWQALADAVRRGDAARGGGAGR
ncbi:G/U mismatch-specific DNA glycosylase [Paraconexibacter sp. AEG42_29]|uniref:G/U mismatch-specific DNA glycosylase n=1 Tax=Paraconexibacter sp. AEG42_29 TaxID=2997339 RepID=A0AAU7AR92_9ACTN